MGCCVPIHVPLFMLKVACLLTIACPSGCVFAHSKGCGFKFNCVHVDCMLQG